jgi:hypothetical protein
MLTFSIFRYIKHERVHTMHAHKRRDSSVSLVTSLRASYLRARGSIPGICLSLKHADGSWSPPTLPLGALPRR